MATEKAAAKFVIPKKIGEAVDLYWTTRAKRYELSKEVEELEKKEATLKAHFIDTIPTSASTGAAGKLCRVTIVKKDRFEVTDWAELQEHIRKNAGKGAFALVQRRLSDAAVKEVFAAGKAVPGVQKLEYKSISVNKVG